jgi:two-component system, NarL family, nitrate/nitrite response regulator NarL
MKPVSDSPGQAPTGPVVLVEDDPVFEQLIVRALSRLGMGQQIRSFALGREALELVASLRAGPSLALVDIGLPDISGIEVISSVHQRFPDTPIMVISVMSGERNVLEAIRAGVRGYLLKDGSEASVAQAIRQVLDGEYPISPNLARHLFRLVGGPQQQASQASNPLSAREMELLTNIASGLSYAECAERMGVALSTVQTHIRSLYRKLEVHSQIQAVSKARNQGLI